MQEQFEICQILLSPDIKYSRERENNHTYASSCFGQMTVLFASTDIRPTINNPKHKQI